MRFELTTLVLITLIARTVVNPATMRSPQPQRGPYIKRIQHILETDKSRNITTQVHTYISISLKDKKKH